MVYTKVFSQGITHQFLLLQRFVVWKLVFPLCDLPQHMIQFLPRWPPAFQSMGPVWWAYRAMVKLSVNAEQLFTPLFFNEVLMIFFSLASYFACEISGWSQMQTWLFLRFPWLFLSIREYVWSRNRKKMMWKNNPTHEIMMSYAYNSFSTSLELRAWMSVWFFLDYK